MRRVRGLGQRHADARRREPRDHRGQRAAGADGLGDRAGQLRRARRRG